MEANQIKTEPEVAVFEQKPTDTMRDLEAVRELSSFELALVGGGLGTVSFL